MVRYVLAHKLYCLAFGIGDTDVFVDAPKILGWLDSKESRIAKALEMRVQGSTYDQIAGELGVSRERARQILVTALRQFKQMSSVSELELVKGVEKLRADLAVLAAKYSELDRVLRIVTKDVACHLSAETVQVLDTVCSVDTLAASILMKELTLSVRSKNCLCRANINTIADFCAMTYSDLLRIRNLGRKSIEECISVVSSLGFTGKWDEQR